MSADAGWKWAVPAWVGQCCSQTAIATCPCGHGVTCHYYAGCYHCSCNTEWGIR